MFRPDPVPYFFIEIQIDLQKPNMDPDPKACCHVAVPVVNDSDGGHAGQHEAEYNHDERVTRNLHSVYIRIRIKTNHKQIRTHSLYTICRNRKWPLSNFDQQYLSMKKKWLYILYIFHFEYGSDFFLRRVRIEFSSSKSGSKTLNNSFMQYRNLNKNISWRSCSVKQEFRTFQGF